MTQQDIADLFGITQPAVSDLFSRNVLKPKSTMREMIRDYCAHLRAQAAGRAAGNAPGELDLVRERARLAKEQADAQEMKNKIERGELIRAEEIEPRLENAFIIAREKWLDSVSRLARELPGDSAEREDLLNREFTEFLACLANWQNAKIEESENE
jgi:phage terminase Nu1 subunit (DNA packaging protein)